MKLELARVEQVNLGLSAGAVAASFALVTPHFATSLAAGAFLEAINLGAIHRGARRLFSGESTDTRGWVGVFSMRFLLLAVAIFVTMQAGAHPVALLVGLSLAMPATVVDAWIHRPPIIDPSTLPTFLEEEDLEDLPGAHAGKEQGDDADDWASYSIWHPMGLPISGRDDLLREPVADDETSEPSPSSFSPSTDTRGASRAVDDSEPPR